jgi:rRNA maturation protein Nop10
MKINILYCKSCDKFTLLESCSCGNITLTTKPAKFSIADKWGKWRRKAKEASKGL